MIPVRAQSPAPTIIRVFPRLDDDQRAMACPACDNALATEPVALVYVGPGDDPHAQARAAMGRWHTGAAVAVHAACAGVTAVSDEPEEVPS